MRGLILAAVLGMATPAFAEDSVPAAESAPVEEAAATSELKPRETILATEPEAVEPVPARPPLSADAVARATFATAIEQLEPVDSITSLGTDRSRVHYFSELVGASGRKVTHRWEYQGETVAEVSTTIGGPRWRVYSSKDLDASQLGEWTVSVIDESGAVLRKDSFVYEAAAPAPAAEEAPDQVPASPAPAQP